MSVAECTSQQTVGVASNIKIIVVPPEVTEEGHRNQPAGDRTADAINKSIDDESARLEGLKHFLDEWNAGKGPRQERDNVVEEAQRETAKASIYSMYINHATRKDDRLVDRWTETLNILLTFAGLQSAAVTAFLIGLDADLKPDHLNTTNKLLQHILFRLDNSTTSTILTPNTNITWVPPASAVRVSAWWYVSLACSLLAAFGALLSKQWIMHYRSQPAWANTREKRAQLREARYLGLKTWWFFGIIDSLPILLQLSLFFFAIGLADYQYPTSPTLFMLIMTFIAFGTIFYAFTTIAGTLFPTCPFKSPVTRVYFKAGWTLMAWGWLCLLTIGGAFVIGVGWLLRYYSYARRMSCQLKNVWRFATTSNPSYGVDKNQGESGVIGENSVGAAGVLCWWVHRDNRTADDACQFDARAAVDSIVSLEPSVVLEYFHKLEIFHHWSGRVVESMDELIQRAMVAPGTVSMRQSDAVQAGDALCHFMYHSPEAARVALSAVNDDAYDDAGHLCQTIRKVWTDPNASSILPIQTMRWTTIAVYLRTQLCDWSNTTLEPGELRYRQHIMQELPLLLKDPRLEEAEGLADVANIVSLAAIALVEDDSDAGELTWSKPCEQLLLALHRLSQYKPVLGSVDDTPDALPSVQPPEIPFWILIRVARIALAKELRTIERLGLFRCSTWKNGELGEALLRLLDLGILYRNGEELLPTAESPGEASDKPAEGQGAATVREVFAFILEIFDYLVQLPSCPGPDTGLFPLSSPIGSALSSTDMLGSMRLFRSIVSPFKGLTTR